MNIAANAFKYCKREEYVWIGEGLKKNKKKNRDLFSELCGGAAEKSLQMPKAGQKEMGGFRGN